MLLPSRRLCILKGIYPRDPRKKKEGKDKTYYHIKDIQYLQHEPLLIKFRELKIFLKKYKKAVSRRDYTRAKTLEEHKPMFTLSHLIKERYPTFDDALRDLDDPLSMCHLFSNLPSNVTPGKNQHTPEKAFDCEKLADEFATLVAHTHGLRKVFVSIKGIYYQAKIQGQDITWLVPHQFNQILPEDVDYRVMLTFLQFYSELLRFVNLKLYHDNNLTYPPVLDKNLYENRGGLKSIQVQAKSANGSNDTAAPVAASAASAPVDASTKKALQKSVAAVVSKLKGKKAQAAAAEDAMDTTEDGQEEEIGDDFAAITGADPESLANKTPDELDAIHSAQVFKGCVFLLSREVPQSSLEFVIKCGGGSVESERDLTPAEAASSRFTHQIIDRPTIAGAKLSTREYIQPQWIYDSFNMYARAPVSSYAPGVVPPPHLSPFVKEETDDAIAAMHESGQGTVYIPKQREIMQSWGAKASWLRKKQAAFDAETAAAESEAAGEDAEELELEAQEARHQAEIALERKGLSHSANEAAKEAATKAAAANKKGKKAAPAPKAVEPEEEDDEEEVDDDEGEGDVVPDSDDDEDMDEDDAEEEEVAPAPSSSRKRKADENDPTELAKLMMGKKDKRLYSRMEYGLNKKKAAVEKLHEKREANEAAEQQQAKKKQKLSASKKK